MVGSIAMVVSLRIRFVEAWDISVTLIKHIYSTDANTIVSIMIFKRIRNANQQYLKRDIVISQWIMLEHSVRNVLFYYYRNKPLD